jgi:hypothetical protein
LNKPGQVIKKYLFPDTKDGRGMDINGLLTFALKLEQVQVPLIKRVKLFYLFRIHGKLLSFRVPGIGHA